MPVVFVLQIAIRVDNLPIAVSASDRHIQAAKGVDDLSEAIEIDHRDMINLDAQIVEDRVFEQGRATPSVVTQFAMQVCGVDALHFPARDIDKQISGD